jgi:ribosome silencing factor RsfS/YbeB/iojap
MNSRKTTRSPARPALVKVVNAALQDMKAVNIKIMDVREVTDVSDCMVVATGNSDRHVRSIADRVMQNARAAGFKPMGMEGERGAEWVLVDLNDVIVHVMLPRVREFYALESLWDIVPKRERPARNEIKAKAKAKAKNKTKGKPKRGTAIKAKKSPSPRSKPGSTKSRPRVARAR